jgi:iron-sulfur cluster repair protein YtfE (RIC family)
MTEKRITGEMVINDVIQHYPWTLPVFYRYGVDSCCGGARTVASAARALGVNLEDLLAELESAAGGPQE